MKEIRKLKANEIEVRVGGGGTLLLYKTSRVDMIILDEVFGPMNWTCDYKEVKGNMYCGIGIRENANEPFVWKWDCGTESNMEAEKGEASDSFKRAGFKVGIGRELYTAPRIKYAASKYDSFEVKEIDYNNGEISKLVIVDSNGKVVYTLGKNYDQVVKQKPKTEPKVEPKKENVVEVVTEEYAKKVSDYIITHKGQKYSAESIANAKKVIKYLRDNNRTEEADTITNLINIGKDL